ncbi:MAG TPA: hypothetical protein VEC16_04685 [Alphaproteobacteria bacterium]|nr:hypothetical protein [Alphaproteobacteria bacterium]
MKLDQNFYDAFENLGEIKKGKLLMSGHDFDLCLKYDDIPVFINDSGIGYISVSFSGISIRKHSNQNRSLLTIILNDMIKDNILDNYLTSKPHHFFYSKQKDDLEFISNGGFTDGTKKLLSKEEKMYGSILMSTISQGTVGVEKDYLTKIHACSLDDVCKYHLELTEKSDLVKDKDILQKEIFNLPKKLKYVFDTSLKSIPPDGL